MLFPWLRRWFGSRSERQAEHYLRQLGYRIIARNWTCHLGELDLVAVDGECIVFVEVRSTASSDAEQPALSVDGRKQQKLTRLALHFLQRHHLLDHAARFDVICLHQPVGGTELQITHFPNAFEATQL